jgi:SSS family solute:Na+ symporter
VSFDETPIGFVIVVAAYVIGGGLIVINIDALQGAIVVRGMTFLLVFTYSSWEDYDS